MSEQKGKQNNDNSGGRIRLTSFSYKAVSWLTRKLRFSKEWKTVEWLIKEHETIIKGVLQGTFGIDTLPPRTIRTREKATSATRRAKCGHHLTEDGKERRIRISRSSERWLSALCSKMEMKHKGYALDWLLKIWQLNNPGLLPSPIQNASTTTVVEQPSRANTPQASQANAPQASGIFDAGTLAGAFDWLDILGEFGEFSVPPRMPQRRMQGTDAVQMTGGLVPSEQNYVDVFKQNYGTVIPIELNYGDFVQYSNVHEGNVGGASETSEHPMEENDSVQRKDGVTVEQNCGPFLQCNNLQEENIGGASKISELQMETNRSTQMNDGVIVEQNYEVFPECTNLQMEDINSAPEIPQAQKYGTFLHCNEFQKENIGSAPEIPQSRKYEGVFQCNNVPINSGDVPFEETYGVVPVGQNYETCFQLDNLEVENIDGIVRLEQNYETLFRFDNLEEENIDMLFNWHDLEWK